MINEMGGDFFQWLRGFYYVAKRQSVTEAAFEMRRNQSTVSHQIKCLEEEFGITLFDRSSGKMELTAEGKMFLDKAISLFGVVKEMKSEIANAQLEQTGNLFIVASHAVVHSFLPSYVRDFRHIHPNVVLNIEGGPLEMVLAKVESAEADFGIVNLDDVPLGLASYDLFQTGLSVLAPKKNPFFQKKLVSLKDIAGSPLVLFPHSSNLTHFIEKKFAENDLKPNVVMVLNNYNSVKKYVALGVGISILDSYTLTKEDKDSLDIFPLDHFFDKRTYSLVLRKKKYLAPPVKAFIRNIKPDIRIE